MFLSGLCNPEASLCSSGMPGGSAELAHSTWGHHSQLCIPFHQQLGVAVLQQAQGTWPFQTENEYRDLVILLYSGGQSL